MFSSSSRKTKAVSYSGICSAVATVSSSSGGAATAAAVGITVLVALVAALLVRFIVRKFVSVLLPQAKADKLPDKQSKPCSVTIDAEGGIYVGQQKVTLEELKERLDAMKKEDPDAAVLVRGDERQEYGRVMEVVKTIYACKIHRMSLVTKGE